MAMEFNLPKCMGIRNFEDIFQLKSPLKIKKSRYFILIHGKWMKKLQQHCIQSIWKLSLLWEKGMDVDITLNLKYYKFYFIIKDGMQDIFSL